MPVLKEMGAGIERIGVPVLKERAGGAGFKEITLLCSAAKSGGLGNLLKVGLGALALECIGQYLSKLCLPLSSVKIE